MRNLHDIVKVVILAVGLPALVCPIALAGEKDGGVTIKKDAITIHPSTKLSRADEKALNDVLKKYDKKLYRLEKYKNGKLTKGLGELQLDQQGVADRAKATTMGYNDNTVTFVYHGNVALAGNLSMTEKEDAKKLAKELTPILQKYEKR